MCIYTKEKNFLKIGVVDTYEKYDAYISYLLRDSIIRKQNTFIIRMYIYIYNGIFSY